MRKKISFENNKWLMPVLALIFTCGAMFLGSQGVFANTGILSINVTYEKGEGPHSEDVTLNPATDTWEVSTYTLADAPTCTDDDYTFAGWEDAAGDLYFAGAEYELEGTPTELTFTAVWTVKVTYNVNLSDDDESITAPAEGNAYYNKDYDIPDTNVLSAEYYTFLGWATEEDAATAEYAAGDTIVAADVKGPITLYAVWNPKFFSVIYHANTDSDANDSAVAVPVDATKYMEDNLTVTIMGNSSLASTNTNYVTMTDATPTRSGYTFAGWATSATATAATYQPGATLTISSDMDLYAVWTTSTSMADTTSTTPQTGAGDHLTLYIVLALLCLTGIGYLCYDQRKAKVTK
jgi:uncharacterized repeat protein (TIGR02543 family)